MATASGAAAGRARSEQLAAYVLHRYDWSETSLIVELFTRAQGRVVVAAKGAKRPTSQLRPVLLPFQPIRVLLGRPRTDTDDAQAGEVRTLRGAEWVGGRPLLAAPAMLCGFYLNELLLKLLARQDPHETLFDAYADTLAALAHGEEEAAALRAFELALLRALGVLPQLNLATLTGDAVAAARGYRLHAEGGLVQRDDGVAGGTWTALEAALRHATASGGDCAPLRQACRRPAGPERAAFHDSLREVLHHHLGHARLRTRQVWRGVQRLAETVPTA